MTLFNAKLIVPESWREEFVSDLISESERAIRERDKFLETGISTASHGGSHDTLFHVIVLRHYAKLRTLVETKPSLPEGYTLAWVDRTYDQRVKGIIAFNSCKGDLDDKLDAAYRATIECTTTVAEPNDQALYVDDSEALRLAAELNISIKFQYGRLTAKRGPYAAQVRFSEAGGDRVAAMRLAIHRVADALKEKAHAQKEVQS